MFERFYDKFQFIMYILGIYTAQRLINEIMYKLANTQKCFLFMKVLKRECHIFCLTIYSCYMLFIWFTCESLEMVSFLFLYVNVTVPWRCLLNIRGKLYFYYVFLNGKIINRYQMLKWVIQIVNSAVFSLFFHFVWLALKWRVMMMIWRWIIIINRPLILRKFWLNKYEM